MRATSALMQIERADDGRSTPWDDEEGTWARKEPARARARSVLVSAAAAAAAGLIVVAGAWWTWTGKGAMGLTASAGVQLAAYSMFQYTGCKNWKEIQIDRMVVQDEAECATKCDENLECTAYNWQRTACEPGWHVDKGCLLFKGSCTTEVNKCWSLHIKPVAPPTPAATTTVSQELTVVSTASAAEIESGVSKALAGEGLSGATVTSSEQAPAARRLDDRALAEGKTIQVTWTLQCGEGEEGACSRAFEFGTGLLTEATRNAFAAKVAAAATPAGATALTLTMTADSPSKVSTGSCMADTAPPFAGEPGDESKYVRMTLAEARPCIDMIKTPAKFAKETVSGLKAWYQDFYAFAYISADPPAAKYTFSPLFKDAKLGVFGAEGGGAPAELSKVDLIGGLQALADSLPEEGDVPLTKWMGPVNDLFNALRDAHTDWANSPDSPLLVDNLDAIFKVSLLSGGKRVSLRVKSAEDAPINGAAVPVVTYWSDGSGRVVESIGGLEPLEWLLKNIVQVPTFSEYFVKSVGARMNKLVMDFLPPYGFEAGLGKTGSLESLSDEPIPVRLKNADGSTSSSSWRWQVIVKVFQPPGCSNFECLVNITIENSKHPGKSAGLLLRVGESMKDWATAGGRREQDELSAGDSATARTPAPAPAAPPRRAQKAPKWPDIFGDDLFALMPEVNGFVAFLKDADGHEYGVFKMFNFEPEGSPETTADYVPYLEVMRKRWDSFNREAKQRGVERLLIDVVSNGGGTTLIAWEIVQFLFSDLPYRDTCGKADRPIPEAYKSWRKINYVGLQEFLPTKSSPRPGTGLVYDRIRDGYKDPALVDAIVSNTELVVSALEDLNVLLPFEKKDIEDALAIGSGTLEMLEAVVKVFVYMWREGYRGQNPFGGDLVMDKAYESPVEKQRGGTSREFTTKWLDCPIGPPGEPTVFTDVIILSDGLCGSSCYMAVGGSRAVAKNQSRVKLRTLTYGGVGGSLAKAQETLSPTSFPGGNVNYKGQEQVINPVLKILLIELMLGNIFGLEALVDELGKVWDAIVAKIPYYSQTLPKFTQSELYMPPFGPNAPPDEYIFYPTDMYLPDWFPTVKTTPEDLKALYASASRAFSHPV